MTVEGVAKESAVVQERTDKLLQIGQFYIFMCDNSKSDVDNPKSDAVVGR